MAAMQAEVAALKAENQQLREQVQRFTAEEERQRQAAERYAAQWDSMMSWNGEGGGNEN
jgi:hypothetical protein